MEKSCLLQKPINIHEGEEPHYIFLFLSTYLHKQFWRIKIYACIEDDTVVQFSTLAQSCIIAKK